MNFVGKAGTSVRATISHCNVTIHFHPGGDPGAVTVYNLMKQFSPNVRQSQIFSYFLLIFALLIL